MRRNFGQGVLAVILSLAVCGGCANDDATQADPKAASHQPSGMSAEQRKAEQAKAGQAPGEQILASGPAIVAQEIEHLGVNHRYAVFLPAGYRPEQEWPLILFLHGMGECGTDGTKQTTVGLPPAALRSPERWPFVILIPQKPDTKKQWEEFEPLLMAMLAKTRAEHRIDGRRMYLTGLSQGGHGSWVLGSRRQIPWAAIAPVCGYADPKAVVPGLGTVPIWAFHGLKDTVVPAAQTRQVVDALTAAGRSDVRVTYYPDADHNSWDAAYAEPELPAWLLQHRGP